MSGATEPDRWRDPGRGRRERRSKIGGRVYTGLYVDEDVFNELRALAVRKRVSLSEQIRQTIDWGLSSMEEV